MGLRKATIVDVDPGTQVPKIACSNGEIAFCKKLSRKLGLQVHANALHMIVAIEAGTTARYWARTLAAVERETRLIAPKFVKP